MAPATFQTAVPITYLSQNSFEEPLSLNDRIYNFVTKNGIFWLGVGLVVGATSLVCSYYFTPFAALGIIPSVIFAAVGARKIHSPQDANHLFDFSKHLPTYQTSAYIRELEERLAPQDALTRPQYLQNAYTVQIREFINEPATFEKFEALLHICAYFPTFRELILNDLDLQEQDAALFTQVLERYNLASFQDKKFLTNALFTIIKDNLTRMTPEAELEFLHALERFMPNLSREEGTPSVRELRQALADPVNIQKLSMLVRFSCYFPTLRELLVQQLGLSVEDKEILDQILLEYDRSTQKDKIAFEKIFPLVLQASCFTLNEEQARDLMKTVDSLSSNSMINFFSLVM